MLNKKTIIRKLILKRIFIKIKIKKNDFYLIFHKYYKIKRVI